jgi:hypothetical protein
MEAARREEGNYGPMTWPRKETAGGTARWGGELVGHMARWGGDPTGSVVSWGGEPAVGALSWRGERAGDAARQVVAHWWWLYGGRRGDKGGAELELSRVDQTGR